MRSSSGGCDMNSRPRPTRPPEMPNARIASGNSPPAPARLRLRRRPSSARIIESRPASFAPPKSARNSRCRENHITIIGRENAEQDLRDEAREEEARSRAALVAQQHAIDDEADHAREKDDERVQDALQQRHRHHVAVRDVADFVAEHGFDLALVEARQEPRFSVLPPT